MATLTGCLRKAGDALPSADRVALLERARTLRASGVPNADAARQAVAERIAAVEAEIRGMTGEGPAVAAEPAAPTEKAEPAKGADEAPKLAHMPPIVGIPREAAQAAHAGTSHVPEQRAVQEQEGFTATLADAWARAARVAGQDEAAIERITEVFKDVAAGYKSRYMAVLGARSRVMSSMIAGPANFPVRRNEKRNETARKRSDEASEYLARGIKRLIRAARGPIDNSPEAELERVRLDLTQREEWQGQMKDTNAALRKGDFDALRDDLGFSEQDVEKLRAGETVQRETPKGVRPVGRRGVPDYLLTNNNAEIRRLRERLKDAEARVAAAEAGPVESERQGVRMVEDAADDRLRLFFDGKPDEAVRDDLKANGFKWSPKNEAWQRQLTDNARSAAKKVMDKHFPAAKPVDAEDAAFGLQLPGTAVATSGPMAAPAAESFQPRLTGLPGQQEQAAILARQNSDDAVFSRSASTQGAYEARIDELFAGEKAKVGTRVLDRSDVMVLLGYPDVPLMLNERHLLDGLASHPEMTAEAWKQVPQWLEDPAAVYTDPAHPGRLTMIAPQRLAGYPVLMVVEPNAGNVARGKGGAVPPEQLLVTVFAKTTGGLPWLGGLAVNGRLLYADTKTAPVIWQRAGDIPRAGGQASGAKRILTQKNLAGYRRENQPPSPDVTASRRRRTTGISMRDAEAVKGAVQAALPNAPEIILHDVVNKAPDDLVAAIRAEGAQDDVEAVYWRGQIHVFPSNIASIERAEFVIGRHEIRHHGMRTRYGGKLDEVLMSMWRANPELRKATQAIVDGGRARRNERAKAIEEALADMPVERIAQLRNFDKLVATVRQWLRQMAASLRRRGFTTLAGAIDPKTWTDNDLVVFVLKAEQVSGEAGQLAAPIEQGGQEARFSRAAVVPEWVDSGSAALKGAAGKISTYAPKKSMTEKVREMSAGWQQRLIQGMADAYAPLKDLSQDAYIAARMTKAADGALEGMLMYGKPVMTDDGGITGDLDGKGFMGIMRDLQGEHDRFFMWLAGNRSAKLLAEGRENLFTPDEIDAMKALNAGTMADGSSRTAAFAAAHRQFNAYSKSVLDVAEKSGLIDGESRAMWESDFYVPFYRVGDDAEISGPGRIKGLVRQKAFEKLKGGKEDLGDLMHNTLRNWSHLLSASLANVAASKSLLAAERAGVAFEASEDVTRQMAKAAGKKSNVVYFMDQGRQRWYAVEDEAVLQAISTLEAPALSGLPLKLMGKFKKYLTLGVTVAPAFKIRNLIRDTLAAPATNQMSYNIAKNLAEGWKATNTKSDDYAQMMFGGGLMRFGTYLEGDRAEHVKTLLRQGVSPNTILDTPAKIKAAGVKMWDAWQNFGDRMENVNRTALYQQRIAAGDSPREAAFKARDMIDFSLQGSWAGMRMLTAVVPFLNARVQGLYRLGRGAKEDPRRFGYVVGATALASIALMLAYGDDDDWKAREDWDRDAFWWFKIGDVAYRIPKPFEIGAMGTIAERSVELVTSDEMTGERFAERMKQMLLGTFAANPIPQMFKPMIDLYANKDSFTGREIESMAMERLSKPERYGPNTSALARVLGSAGDITNVSPIQVDHLIRAYFGWLGVQATVLSDVAASPFGNDTKPALKLDDFMGGFVKQLPVAQSRYVEDFYRQARVVSQAAADLKRARESGDFDRAAELAKDNESELATKGLYAAASRRMSDINKRIRAVRASTSLSAEEKRARIDALTADRNALAKSVNTRARSLEAAH